MSWYINEEGLPYFYAGTTVEQEDEFPNDDHVPYDSEDEAFAAIEEEAVEVEEEGDVTLSNCQLSFMVNVTDVKTLQEALTVAASNLGRYGMDAFYVLAEDPDSGRQWIVHDGRVMKNEQFIAEHGG